MGRRRRCAVSGAALAGVDGVIRPFANVGLFGGFADADGHMRDSLPDWLRHDGTAADAWAPTTTNVTTARLVSVLRRHGAPAVVDYLSLDVEGAEYEVLADPELHAAFAFRAISVEHNAHRHGFKTRDALRRMLAGFGYEVVEAGRTDTGDAIDDFYVPREPPGTPGPNVVAVLRPRATNGASSQLAAVHALVAVVNAVGGLDLAAPSLALPDGGRVSLSAIADSAELGACVSGAVVAEATAAGRGGGRARILCFADHIFEALGESPEGLGRCGELAARFGCAAAAPCAHGAALLLDLDLASYADAGWTADVVDLSAERDGDALLAAMRDARAAADALVFLDPSSAPDLARAAFVAPRSVLCAETAFGGLFALPREAREAAVVAAKTMCGGDFAGVHWRRDDYCGADEGCASVEVVARAAAKAAAGGCVFVATDERDAEVLERFEKAVRRACDGCTVTFETSFFADALAAGTPASGRLAAATAAKATLALARTFVATTHPHWGLSSFSWHVGAVRFAAGRAGPTFVDDAAAVAPDRFSPAEPYWPGGRTAAPDTRRGPGPDGGAPLRGSPPLALPDGTASVVLNIGSSLDPALPAPGSIGVVTVAFEPLPDVAAAIPVRPNLVVVAAAVAAYDGLGGMRRYNEGGVSSSLHTAARRGEWNANTTRGDGARVVVPVLALGKILESIREDVFFLKTDMQGADFDAVSSVDRKLLRRVSFLATETWAENARTYAGVANDLCRDWVPAMERAGFVLVHVAPVFAVPYVSDHAAFAEAFVVHDRCGRDDAVPTQFEYCEADAYWVRDDVVREMGSGDFTNFDALSARLRPADWPVQDFRGLPRRPHSTRPPRPAGRVGAYVGVRDCALARVHGNSSLLEQRILELLQVASLETIIVEATSNAATTVARRYFPVTTVVARTEGSVAARAAAASRAEDLDVVLYVDAASVSGDSDRFEALLAAFFEAGSHDAALIDDDAEPTAVVVSIDALSAAGLRGRKPRVVESTRGIDACANPAAARGASRISSNARVAPVLHRYPRVEGEISLNGVVHTFNISDADGAIAGQIERICARLGCDEAGIGALMNYAWTRTPRA